MTRGMSQCFFMHLNPDHRNGGTVERVNSSRLKWQYFLFSINVNIYYTSTFFKTCSSVMKIQNKFVIKFHFHFNYEFEGILLHDFIYHFINLLDTHTHSLLKLQNYSQFKIISKCNKMKEIGKGHSDGPQTFNKKRRFFTFDYLIVPYFAEEDLTFRL